MKKTCSVQSIGSHLMIHQAFSRPLVEPFVSKMWSTENCCTLMENVFQLSVSSSYRRKHFLLCQQKKSHIDSGQWYGISMPWHKLYSEDKFPSHLISWRRASAAHTFSCNFLASLNHLWKLPELKAVSVSVSMHYFIPPWTCFCFWTPWCLPGKIQQHNCALFAKILPLAFLKFIFSW